MLQPFSIVIFPLMKQISPNAVDDRACMYAKAGTNAKYVTIRIYLEMILVTYKIQHPVHKKFKFRNSISSLDSCSF